MFTWKQLSSNQKVAYIFPGQGSQVVGMGADLFQSSPEARATFEEADEVLGFPLSRLCFEGPDKELRKTVNAQPAILTVSVACLKVASEVKELPVPAFVTGHSLGEYTALVAADVLDFADALKLVWERGRLMQEAGELYPGGMAAVIGFDRDLLKEVCQETGVVIANINSPTQIVISGAKENLAKAMDIAKIKGARRVVPLDVSGAFHSALMKPAAEGMAQALPEVSLRQPKIPIVANSTAQPLSSANSVRDELLRQLLNPILWQPSIEYAIKTGVSTFLEFGPGRVLTGLVKRIDKKVKTVNVSGVTSIENLVI